MNDPESQNLDNAFSEKSIRLGFIRKVYAILMVQLIIVMAFIAIFLFVDSVKQFSMRHPEMLIIAGVLAFVLIIAMSCCEGPRRTYPLNYICLFVYTIAESFVLGAAASQYNTDTVIIAVGICAVICLGLTLFAFQTKYDFTRMWGILLVLVLVLFCFSILMAFFHNRILHIVISCLGALVFSVYLVVDTQLMMGGKHQYAISPEEYVFAALNLYLDVVNLLLYLLRIVAQVNEN